LGHAARLAEGVFHAAAHDLRALLGGAVAERVPRRVRLHRLEQFLPVHRHERIPISHACPLYACHVFQAMATTRLPGTSRMTAANSARLKHPSAYASLAISAAVLIFSVTYSP